MDKNHSDNTLREIYLLYELSLAVGQSLNISENCKHFVNALHARKNLDFASVWIDAQHLPNEVEAQNEARLVYAIPKFRAAIKQLSLDHPSFTVTGDQDLIVIDDTHPLFTEIVAEKKIEQGIYGIFKLNDFGILKIYSSNKEALAIHELNKLRSVIKKFAFSIEGSIAHQSSIENEKKITKIINAALDAVIIINDKGHIIHWNPQAVKTFGWTKEEVLHKEMGQFIIPHQHRKAHADGMVHYNRTGEGPVLNNRIEITAIRKSGETFDVELTVMPIELPNNTIFAAFIRDITDAKKAKQALIEAREKAEASVKAKERFLANMSHEFRTPLNAIYGMGELLERTSISSKQQQYLDVLKVSAQNLMVIVNDVLDASKIDSDILEIEKIGFRLRDILFNIIQAEKTKIIAKDIELEWHLDRKVAPVLIGDPVRLHQILLNLTSNASKFTPEGKVELLAELVETNDTHQTIQFSVKDTGIGIEQEKIETIFESFRQEDESITRRFGGTGLGLSISKKLVELFGGTLEVESEKNVGTCFFFTLKLAIGTDADLPKSKDVQPFLERIKGIDVLLVEDHDLNQFWATKILEEYEMKVSLAVNGVEAVEMVRQNQYDIILMDMHMPEMDGLEATRIIRNELKSTVPIIALTANSITQDRNECIKVGMNDFLSKPFESAVLIKIMHRLLVEKNVETEEASLPLYNLEKLERQTNNNQDFMKKMILMFVQRLPSSMDEIEQHHQQQDWERVYAIAHKLKPSIDMLDIVQLKTTIRAIEEAAKYQKDLETLPEHVQTLRRVGEEVIVELNKDFEL